MFSSIYLYELKYWLKKPATYLYFGAFFAIALLIILGTGGFFDEPSTSTKQVRLLNSPYEINYILQYFNKFFLFLLPAIIGTTLYKDYQDNVHNILYSFPLQKKSYLLGKFFSAFTIVLIITCSLALGFLLGETILGIENPKIGKTNLWAYGSAYLFFVLPNIFIYGLLVFMVVCLSRNIYAGFITILLLFFLQTITQNLFIGHPFLIALTDPFGQLAATYETQLWTLAEQNTLPIPSMGIVLYNRLFWLVLTSILFALFYQKFTFSQEGIQNPLKRRKSNIAAKKTGILGQVTPKIALSKVQYDFSIGQHFKAMFRLSAMDFRYIIRSWMFHLLVFFGIFAILFAIGKVTNTGELILLPTTSIVLSVPMLFFSSIITLITFLFSGMLVHRAKMSKSDQLIDISSLPNWTFLGSKIVAIIQIQFLLLLLMMLCGIVIQVYNGYFHFEIGLYLFRLFILTFPTLIIWAFASIFIHSLFPNLYLGLFTLLLGWVGKDQLHRIGLDTHLVQFNSTPQLQYSDMNGFGGDLTATFLLHAYWFVFAAILFIFSYLLWQRGFTFSFKERLQIAVSRFKGFLPYATIACLIPFFLLGKIILQEENKSTTHLQSDKSRKTILEDFKTNYERYKNTPQPKITAVKLKVDLFPENQSFTAMGDYTIVNKHTGSIDTLLIKTGFDESTQYTISQENSLVSRDSIFQFAVHKLESPLAPKDSLTLHFEVKNKANTLFERNSIVLENGTFIKNDVLPRLGYFLDSASKHPSDSSTAKVNFYSRDADLIDFEATISTTAEQTAIAPGYLQKQWTEKGRNFYHYKMDKKIRLLFAFNSGVFSLQKESYKDINLEVYHHPSHTFNTTKMMDGLKAAIDYNTQFFSPYQHREARIIEFPLSEGTYATTMANSIPMSEARFVVNPNQSEDQIDLSFYVPAHELTHQWFGAQLVPADAQGNKMLTESLTEYVSLRIYENYYGKEKALGFLQFQRERYLKGRTKEEETEKPLYLVKPEQMYISYGKGAMAFNALQHYWGEENLNASLKDFLEMYRFKTDLYPRTTDLIAHLRASCPKELQYLIEDYFEAITFYDNQIMEVKTASIEGGEFEVSVDFEVRKYRDGEENNSLPLNDFIEVGFYNEKGELFAVEKVKVTELQNQLRIVLKESPIKIVIDPNCLVIDKELEDNEWVE